MKNAPRLAIFSRQARMREELVHELDSLKEEFIDLIIDGLDMSQLSTFNALAVLVIVDLEKWVPSDELALSELRESGYEGPVIVLTKRLDEASSADYTKERIIFFDRSRSTSELIGIARRMMMGSLIAARKHPRHATNEKAEVRVLGNLAPLTCKVVNLSKGGALLRLEKAAALKVGDTCTLKIKLSQVNRAYSVRGRVAWVKLPTFGVEFLDDEES